MSHLSKIDRQAFHASVALEELAKAIYYARCQAFRLETGQWSEISFELRAEYREVAKAVLFMEQPEAVGVTAKDGRGNTLPAPAPRQPLDFFSFAASGARTIATRLRETHGFDAYIGPPEAS